MIDLISPLALILHLFWGGLRPDWPPPLCPKRRPCAVLVTGARGDTWTCFRRHRGGPCNPWRRRP